MTRQCLAAGQQRNFRLLAQIQFRWLTRAGFLFERVAYSRRHVSLADSVNRREAGIQPLDDGLRLFPRMAR